jgi:antitoxin (DNA-binding transcriptional repressor) of toxin-antitoxin stability system
VVRISIRKLQQSFSKYLKKLPILVTRYGHPVAMVVKIDKKKEE